MKNGGTGSVSKVNILTRSTWSHANVDNFLFKCEFSGKTQIFTRPDDVILWRALTPWGVGVTGANSWSTTSALYEYKMVTPGKRQ